MEILVVISIVSILTGMAMLSAKSMLSTYRVNGATRQIYSDLQFTRLNAIKSNNECAFEFSGSTYCIKNSKGANDDWDAGCSGSDDVTVKTSNLSNDYYGITINKTFTRMRFYSDGTAKKDDAGTDTTITICNSARAQKILINTSTGNIRIDKDSAAPCP